MLLGFLLVSVVLAIINIPLSAYTTDQEFTYHPNATLPPLPFSSLIPSILQHPTGVFSPQVLSVGNVIQLNSSVFNFTVAGAFDDNTGPVSSFSYYNNPLSDGCDIARMTAYMQKAMTGDPATILQLTVTVSCHNPTHFMLDWNGTVYLDKDFLSFGSSPVRDDLSLLASDLVILFEIWDLLATTDIVPLFNYGITVEPWCNCSTVSSTSLIPTQPPCSSLPVCLVVVEQQMSVGPPPKGSKSEPLGRTPTDVDLVPRRLGQVKDPNWSGLDTLLHNTLQSLYHVVRLELGIILENQIYLVAGMYNRSISDVYVPSFIEADDGVMDELTAANDSRRETSNATVMAKWVQCVEVFERSARVPVMPYLRPIPRLKPLGSAVTSVFVSTFAMLSVLWTIFGIIAGAFAKERADEADRKDLETAASLLSCEKYGDLEEQKGGNADSENDLENSTKAQLLHRLARAVEANSSAIAEIQRFQMRMRTAPETDSSTGKSNTDNGKEEQRLDKW